VESGRERERSVLRSRERTLAAIAAEFKTKKVAFQRSYFFLLYQTKPMVGRGKI